MLARLVAAVLVVFLVSPRFAAGEETRQTCLPPTAVDRALHEGRAERFATIARSLDGEVLRTELCEGADGLVYRVTLIDGRGSVRRLLLDARSGRLVYDGR